MVSPAERRNICVALASGVARRGEGGFLLLRGDDCAYVFPDELSSEEAKTKMTRLLASESSRAGYFVMDVVGGRAHVVAFPRTLVYEEAQRATDEYRRAGAEGAVEEVAEDQADEEVGAEEVVDEGVAATEVGEEVGAAEEIVEESCR